MQGKGHSTPGSWLLRRLPSLRGTPAWVQSIPGPRPRSIGKMDLEGEKPTSWSLIAVAFVTLEQRVPGAYYPTRGGGPTPERTGPEQ